MLIPEPAKNPGFDIHYTVSTPHHWFACAHLLDSHLPQSCAVTFPKRSPPWLLATAALGSLKPTPASRLRGAFPHLLYSCVRLQVKKSFPPVCTRGALCCQNRIISIKQFLLWYTETKKAGSFLTLPMISLPNCYNLFNKRNSIYGFLEINIFIKVYNYTFMILSPTSYRRPAKCFNAYSISPIIRKFI